MDAQHHLGVMRTTVDDCQFVCIAQEHYFRILTQGKKLKGMEVLASSDKASYNVNNFPMA